MDSESLLPLPGGSRVIVQAPARLHMGFLDMSGSLDRKFGSVGVGINEIATRLTLEHATETWIQGPEAERTQQIVYLLEQRQGRSLPAKITIQNAIPHHAGLGSGTQLALAVASGLSRLHGLGLSLADVASVAGRGSRSGIGIAVFEQGGLIVDAGRGPSTTIPPVVSRLEIPSDWYFLVLLDTRDQGLHGADEIQAFKALPVFPAREAARLCHLLLMKGLPAVAEHDITAFGSVITELQASIGDHFASAQGGRFTSPLVNAALDYLSSCGAVGIGQSSWGPTGFCLVQTLDKAERLQADLQQHLGTQENLICRICTPRNRSAEITIVDASTT